MGYRSEIVAGVPIENKKEALSIINDWDQIGESEDTKFDRDWETSYYF